MGLPRQEFWSGLPFPSPGDLPNPGIERASPALQADSLPLSHLGSPEEQPKVTVMDHHGPHATFPTPMVPEIPDSQFYTSHKDIPLGRKLRPQQTTHQDLVQVTRRILALGAFPHLEGGRGSSLQVKERQ